MKTSIELRQQRAKLYHDMRAIVNRAEDDDRDLNTEEQSEYEKINTAIDDLDKRITRLEQLEASEDEQQQSAGRGDDDKQDERDDDEEQKSGHRSLWSRNETRADKKSSKEYRKAFSDWLRTGSIPTEFRDISLGTDSAGGYLAAPIQVSRDLTVAINNLTFVRQLANVEQVLEAKSLGCPQITTDISDADWTAEAGALTADSSFTLARRDLTPQLLSKLVLVSIRELQAVPNVEAVVLQRIAYKFSVAEENGFLNGDGSGEPLGAFVAHNSGIPTSRDVTASATTSFSADDLLNVVYKIPAQYQASKSFGWIMHRDAVKMARKLKDGMGQYLLQPGIAADRGDTLCGYRLYQSEYAPNTFTTGKYLAVLGDWQFYKIAETVDFSVQRLVERYSDTNQVGFIGRHFLDGSPILPTAFARLITA